MRTFNNLSREASLALFNNASDTVFNLVFATATAKTVTIPTGATAVAFASTGNFYVDFGGAAAVIPSADNVAGNGDVLNPTSRSLAGLTTFSVIAAAGTVMSLSFFNLN